jgi:hypothetical protein
MFHVKHRPPMASQTAVWAPEVIGRQDFCREFFDYEPGQHVVFAGPTQMAGKTTLSFQLLEYTATPELPAYVLVSKPRDPVTLKEGRRLGYRFVTEWPVPRQAQEMWRGRPPGYVIWPKFGDIDADLDKAAAITSEVMKDRYKAGTSGKHKGIMVVDDTVTKSKLMGLDRYMTTHIAMAGAMDLGGWYFVQKPTDSGRAAIWAYGNSAHVFISHDADKKNRDRYDEIGGFDPREVSTVSKNLKPYQFLYLCRTNNTACIVDAK